MTDIKWNLELDVSSGLLPEGYGTVLRDLPEANVPGSAASIEGMSLYVPPQENLPDTHEFQENPLIQDRLRIALELEKFKKSEAMLAKLDAAEKNQSLPADLIQAHREVLNKQVDLLALHKSLFLHMSSLLMPEGYPISMADYTRAVNGLFDAFFGKLEGGQSYFKTAQLEKIFTKGPIDHEGLYLELSALSAEAHAQRGPIRIDTPALPGKIKDWLAQTENLGFKNSVAYERGQFQEILNSLKDDKKPTFHCENLLKITTEIEGLVQQGRSEEAKKVYLGKYSSARRFVLDLYQEYEQIKKIKHYTVGVAIVVAAGFLAALTEGATTPLLIQAGARLSLAKVGGALANGLTFVTAERLLNKAILGKDFWDPKKSTLENAGDFALKSLFMAALNPYLKEVVHASRSRSLLPEIARKGLPQELLKDGILDLSGTQTKYFLAQLFEKEIAAMSRVDRALFKGKEFTEEVFAFVGWELLESQVNLLAAGKKPSLENLKVIEAILSPQAMPDRVAFLAALKAGNRMAKPITDPLADRVNQWGQKKIISTISSKIEDQLQTLAEASTGELGPWLVPDRQIPLKPPQTPSREIPLQPAEVAYSRLASGPISRSKAKSLRPSLPTISELVDELASALHEDWRASRAKEDGSIEASVRNTQDQTYIDAHHGRDEVDIANNPYPELPADWRAIKQASAEVAIQEVEQAINQGGELDANFVEQASARVRERQLENHHASSARPKVSFAELTETEKDPFRAVVREAIDIYHRLRYPNGYKIAALSKDLGFEETDYVWALVRDAYPGMSSREIREAFKLIDSVLPDKKRQLRQALLRAVVTGHLDLEVAETLKQDLLLGRVRLGFKGKDLIYHKIPKKSSDPGKLSSLFPFALPAGMQQIVDAASGMNDALIVALAGAGLGIALAVGFALFGGKKSQNESSNLKNGSTPKPSSEITDGKPDSKSGTPPTRAGTLMALLAGGSGIATFLSPDTAQAVVREIATADSKDYAPLIAGAFAALLGMAIGGKKESDEGPSGKILVEKVHSDKERREKISEALREAEAEGLGQILWSQSEGTLAVSSAEANAKVLELFHRAVGGEEYALEELIDASRKNPVALKALYSLLIRDSVDESIRFTVSGALAFLHKDGTPGALDYLVKAAEESDFAVGCLIDLALYNNEPLALKGLVEAGKHNEEAVEGVWRLVAEGHPDAWQALGEIARARMQNQPRDPVLSNYLFRLNFLVQGGDEESLHLLFEISQYFSPAAKLLHHIAKEICGLSSEMDRPHEDPAQLKQLYEQLLAKLRTNPESFGNRVPNAGKKDPSDSGDGAGGAAMALVAGGAGIATLLSSEPAQAMMGLSSMEGSGPLGFWALGALTLLGMALGRKSKTWKLPLWVQRIFVGREKHTGNEAITQTIPGNPPPQAPLSTLSKKVQASAKSALNVQLRRRMARGLALFGEPIEIMIERETGESLDRTMNVAGAARLEAALKLSLILETDGKIRIPDDEMSRIHWQLSRKGINAEMRQVLEGLLGLEGQSFSSSAPTLSPKPVTAEPSSVASPTDPNTTVKMDAVHATLPSPSSHARQEPLGVRIARNLLKENPLMPLIAERQAELRQYLEAFTKDPETPFPPWILDLAFSGQISGGFKAHLLPDFPQHRGLSGLKSMRIIEVDLKENILTLQSLPGNQAVKTLRFRSRVGPLPFQLGETVFLMQQIAGGVGFLDWMRGLIGSRTEIATVPGAGPRGGPDRSQPYRSGSQANLLYDPFSILSLVPEATRDVDASVQALGKLAQNSQFRDFEALLPEILHSGAKPETILDALARIASNPNFTDFFTALEAIRVSRAPTNAKLRALGKVGSNPNFTDFDSILQAIEASDADPSKIVVALAEVATHPSFRDFERVLRAIHRSSASANAILEAYGILGTNPNFPNLEGLVDRIHQTAALMHHNAFALAMGRIASNPNFHDVGRNWSLIAHSGANSETRILALAFLASNPHFTNYCAVLGEIVHSYWPTREEKAEALAQLAKNQNFTQFESLIDAIHQTRAHVDIRARALAEVAKHKNLPSDLYEKIMEDLFLMSEDAFLEALSASHPQQSQYLNRLLSGPR